MRHSPFPEKVEEEIPSFSLPLLYVSLLIAFADVHTPISVLSSAYDRVTHVLLETNLISRSFHDNLVVSRSEFLGRYLIPVKNFSFLSALLVLFFPIVRSLFALVRVNREFLSVKAFGKTLVVFLILGILVVPDRLGVMGVGYAQMSVSLFGFIDESGQIYRRVLMSALAYLFQMREPTLFFLFSMICAFLLVHLTIFFFTRQGIRLPLLYAVSLGTSSFVITNFQSPGYPDPLVFALLLVAFCFPLGTWARLSIVGLSLLAHEASIFIVLPLAYFCFTRREFLHSVWIAGLYVACWLMSTSFVSETAFSLHSVGGHPAVWWVLQHPLLEVLAFVFSYKFLWIIVGSGFVYAGRQMIFPILLVGSGILLAFLGVDTSRMLGYGFLGVLIAISFVIREEVLAPKYVKLLMILNIAVPAAYVGVNAGVFLFDGVYKILYFGYFMHPL